MNNLWNNIREMEKILVLQHVAREVYGTLDPLLKEARLRTRYVNFDREPSCKPTLDKYSGLFIMGGPMGVYEKEKYSHLKVELRLVEEALKNGIPILGICLGAQIVWEFRTSGRPLRGN